MLGVIVKCLVTIDMRAKVAKFNIYL